MKYFELYDLKCSDIAFDSINCGKEECDSGKFFGPYLRDRYIIHYIESGTGIFKIHNREHTVNKGEIFFIPPNVMTYYKADKINPWKYKWVGIRSDNLEGYFNDCGISESNPVIKVSDSISYAIDNILSASESNNTIKLTACIWAFLEQLSEPAGSNSYKTNGELYASEAIRYINQYIYRKITVNELAGYVGVDRSYLTAIFKKQISLSPQQYIISKKIKVACKYLNSTDYDITHIAQSVGYDDLFAFSHAFKRIVGVSPKVYREQNRGREKT